MCNFLLFLDFRTLRLHRLQNLTTRCFECYRSKVSQDLRVSGETIFKKHDLAMKHDEKVTTIIIVIWQDLSEFWPKVLQLQLLKSPRFQVDETLGRQSNCSHGEQFITASISIIYFVFV